MNYYNKYKKYKNKYLQLKGGAKEYVYHGSPINFDIGKPSYTQRGTLDKINYKGVSFHATPHRYIALNYLAKRTPFTYKGDKYHYTTGVSLFQANKFISIYGYKSLEDSLNIIYGDGGYLYTFDAKDFHWVEGLGPLEVISLEPLKPIKKEFISGKELLEEMKKEGVQFRFKDITKDEKQMELLKIKDNLTLNELQNIIKNITPYYYVEEFKTMINKLIKEAKELAIDEDQKIIYVVNNINDMHFQIRKKPVYKNNYSSGIIIIYTKKNGVKFSSKRDGKYVVIKSVNPNIKIGDTITHLDGEKVTDVITNFINFSNIPGFNPIKTLGDLQKRSLDLLKYYHPKVATVNGKEVVLEDKEIKLDIDKKQFYKDIKINNKDALLFSTKSFNFRTAEEESKYLKDLQYLKDNINKFDYIVLDLRSNEGGSRHNSNKILDILYNKQIVEYIYSKERLQRVFKKSDQLKEYFKNKPDMLQKIDEVKGDYIMNPRDKEVQVDLTDKSVNFKGALIVLTDFNCGSTCSILLSDLKLIRQLLDVKIIILGTEDNYDTKFTQPTKIEYDNYTVLAPTMYRNYRIRDNYEVIEPDYYYYDETLNFDIPVDVIESVI
jgi:hypothetical protein